MKKVHYFSINFSIPKIVFSNNESIIDIYNKILKEKLKKQFGENYLDNYSITVEDVITTSGYHSKDTDYTVKLKLKKIK